MATKSNVAYNDEPDAPQLYDEPGTAPTDVNYDAEATKLFDESYTRLSGILGSMQGVDHEKLFAPYREKIAARPTEKAPGRLESFALGFGSKFGAQSAMQRIANARESEGAKEKELMGLEGKILEAQINEQMQKGQTKQALATMKERQMLEHRVGRLVGTEKHEQAMEMERVKGEVRGNIEEIKGSARVKAAQERAKTIASGLGYDERVALKLLDFAMRGRLSRNTLTGRLDITDEDITSSLAEIQEMMDKLPKTEKPGTTPPPAVEAPAGGTKSRARIAAEKIKAARTKKKE